MAHVVLGYYPGSGVGIEILWFLVGEKCFLDIGLWFIYWKWTGKLLGVLSGFALLATDRKKDYHCSWLIFRPKFASLLYQVTVAMVIIWHQVLDWGLLLPICRLYYELDRKAVWTICGRPLYVKARVRVEDCWLRYWLHVNTSFYFDVHSNILNLSKNLIIYLHLHKFKLSVKVLYFDTEKM